MIPTYVVAVPDDRGQMNLAPLVEKGATYVGRRFADGSILLERTPIVPHGGIPGVIEPKL